MDGAPRTENTVWHPSDVDRSDRWETIRQIANSEARRPSDLRPGFNKDIERILMKALSKKPEDRYETAGAFGKDIKKFLKQLVRDKEGRKET